MEPYSIYIISAFALAGVLLAGLAFQSIWHLRSQQRKMNALQDDNNEA